MGVQRHIALVNFVRACTNLRSGSSGASHITPDDDDDDEDDDVDYKQNILVIIVVIIVVITDTTERA